MDNLCSNLDASIAAKIYDLSRTNKQKKINSIQDQIKKSAEYFLQISEIANAGYEFDRSSIHLIDLNLGFRKFICAFLHAIIAIPDLKNLDLNYFIFKKFFTKCLKVLIRSKIFFALYFLELYSDYLI
jgi:hypothetical protein